VEKLLELAETANDQGNRGLNIPAEIARREERLKKIAEAKAEIERRAQECHAREKAEYDEKMARRAAQEKQTGKKPAGREPKVSTPGPQDKDQVNFTDEESRIMPVSGGGFEQAYNGQIGVDGDSRLIACQHVSQQPNDKQALVPALDQLAQLPEELGKVKTASADTGYYSEDNVVACAKADVVPYIACGREPHYPPLAERLAGAPQAPENPDPVSVMRHRLKTAEGALCQTQIHCRASFRDYQTRDRVSAIHVTWFEGSPGRVDARLHCLQSEALAYPKRGEKGCRSGSEYVVECA
jgi:hypothetical protein